MSAAERMADPQSPRDGMMSRFVKNVFLTKGHIASAEKLSEHFYLVSVKGEALKHARWTPGDKIQINMGIGFSTRTYTPMSWDAESGQTQIIVYLHGDTPGCQWARHACPRQAVEFLGPRRSLDLPSVAAHAVLFGDETSFGLATALRHRAGGESALCVFEAAELGEARAVLGAIGITDAVLIELAHDDSHLAAVHDALLRQATSDTQFVLSGKAPSIQSVKRALAAAGVSNTRQKAKAYWAPGKVGMD